MSIKDIPVRVIGPGSQPGESDGQTLSYIDMPSDMATYREPIIPDPESVQELAGAREAMDWLRQSLADYEEGDEPQIANLGSLDAGNRELVNQILGEGEVSMTYTGGVHAKTQEATLAGVWRTVYFDSEGNPAFDLLEVGDVAHIARMPDGRERAVNASPEGIPDDVVNALPILVELEAKCAEYEPGSHPHVINLSLLPLSTADAEFLDQRLGRGPIDTLSRAYGKCQVISTLTPNVWWVRYYNSMGVLILNTLEVVDVPGVLRAAPEDIRDSLTRLESILAPYWSDVA